MGAQAELSRYLGLLTDAYLVADRIEEGLETVGAGLDVVKKTNERFYEAELYRLRGELLLRAEKNHSRKQQLSDAENSFRQAIRTARRQKAESLDLRATMGLSRLWQRVGKRKEAHAMLGRVCAWFTAGLNAPDLIEALELLKQLS